MNLYVFKVFVVFCSFSLTVDMIWLFWNESGPEIEPWGTPHVMLVWADVNLLIVTQKFLLCRFHVNQLTVFSSTTALMSPGDPACGCRLLMCSMVPVRPLTSRLSSHADMVIDSMLASGQLEEDGREKVREAMLRRHHHQSEKNLRNRIPLVRSFADIGKKHSDPHLLERNGETAELLSFWYSLMCRSSGRFGSNVQVLIDHTDSSWCRKRGYVSKYIYNHDLWMIVTGNCASV